MAIKDWIPGYAVNSEGKASLRECIGEARYQLTASPSRVSLTLEEFFMGSRGFPGKIELFANLNGGKKDDYLDGFKIWEDATNPLPNHSINMSEIAEPEFGPTYRMGIDLALKATENLITEAIRDAEGRNISQQTYANGLVAITFDGDIDATRPGDEAWTWTVYHKNGEAQRVIGTYKHVEAGVVQQRAVSDLILHGNPSKLFPKKKKLMKKVAKELARQGF